MIAMIVLRTAKEDNVSKSKLSFEQKMSNIVANVVFYRDVYDSSTLYAEFEIYKGTIVFTSIDSPMFNSYLRMTAIGLKYYDLTTMKMKDYIRDYFTVIAPAPSVEAFVRTAGSLRSGIEYDLHDDCGKVVSITPKGWSITTTSTKKFTTFPHMQAQDVPVNSDKSLIDLLAPYVNLKGDYLKLFAIWLAQSMSAGSHSCLLVSAERGSGKSYMSKTIRAILDPSTLDVTALPSKTENLSVILTNTYFVAFDNVSMISKDISDLLCSAITGATIAKRTLFSTNDLSVFKMHNTLIINGIALVPDESDLAERMILMKLKKLSGQKLKEERKLWAEFKKDKPEILGAIFSVLSSAMNIIDTLQLTSLPRMANSFVEMCAIAMAMGIPKEEFINIYDRNITTLNKERAHTPLVEAIREYMNSPLVTGRKAEDYANNLLTNIRDYYSGDKNLLPKSASAFSKRLKAERNVLDAIGFNVNIDDTPAKGTLIAIIKNKTATISEN